jgi:F-type H+-transporting ATPase subunit a
MSGQSVSPIAKSILESQNYYISNSMVATWVVAITLIVLTRLATKNMKLVPSGLQNIMEAAFESIYNLLESILGHHLTKKTFWFFSVLFIFIVASNWSGLLPLTGNFVVKYGDTEIPIWRPGTADVNLTLAMSLTFMVLWFIWSIQEVGFGGFIKHIFAPKGNTPGFMGIIMVLVALAIGLIEVISLMFRPISLSLRLYGNIFGGENVMHSMALPIIGVPFYFLELMVGLIQGMVFTMLSAVFLALMCEHEHEHEHEHELEDEH